MHIVYDSFAGRFSDNPRALFRHFSTPGGTDTHTWLCDPAYADGYPSDVLTVPHHSLEAVAALEEADLVVANTHIELDWTKKPGAVYLQTWHGTPLKRVHRDVLWAPEGRVEALDVDVARWDYLVSPNTASTPRLRDAFRFTGEILEVGYPRNDILRSAEAPAVRARVRAELGIEDGVTAVLYTPTWRDDEFYAVGDVSQALDIDAFVRELGPDHVLLTRRHNLVTDRYRLPEREGVIEVSRHPDVHELFLAADVMITDYSSTMFDFAITGKPLLFFAYDLENYRDTLRGFYFDLDPVAPGPVLRTSDQVLAALRDLEGVTATYAERYRAFQAEFSHLEDGHAADRLARFFDQPSRQPQLTAHD